MKDYGQFCPLAQAAQILCERWTIIIVRELIAGSTRYSELQKGVPQISPSLLATRLKQLVKANIIKKLPGKTGEYQLTQAGSELRPIVEMFGAWGHRWAKTDLKENDLDPGLLMWDMRRSVDPDIFPKSRIVVQFEYPDAPPGGKDWWLISENGEVDLCREDPGMDVNLVIRCSLKAMTSVWTCQTTFDDQVNSRNIKVLGDSKLKSHLQNWLCSSLLSKLGTYEKFPKLAWGTV